MLIGALTPAAVLALNSDSVARAAGTTDSTTSITQAATYRYAAQPGGTTEVQRSRDGGLTWLAVGTIPEVVVQLAVNPANDAVVSARTGRSLWRTGDSGMTWARINSLPGRPIALLFTGGGSPAGLIFAGTDTRGLYSSPDSGTTWQPAGGSLSPVGAGSLAVTALAVNPDDPHSVYAAATFTMAAPSGLHTSQNVFLSADDGRRWSVPADEVTRARVATALGLLHAETVIPQLAMTLKHAGTQARRHAAETLAGIGTPEAVAALVKPLREVELTPARYMAMQGLTMAGQSAVTPLRIALLDRDPVMRRNAAEMLGWLGATDAVPNLVQSLSDRDAGVRNQATWALGEMHTVAAQLALRPVASGEAGGPVLRATSAAPADAAPGADVRKSSTVFQSMWSNAMDLVTPGRWTSAVLASLLTLAILAAMLMWKGPLQRHVKPS